MSFSYSWELYTATTKIIDPPQHNLEIYFTEMLVHYSLHQHLF